MVNDFLPIGSVVLLKNEVKKLMIVGILPIKQGEPEVMYDYIGVLYPEGFVSNEFSFLFNHEDITDVIFEGYNNKERKEFIEAVAASYDSEMAEKEG